MAKRWNSREIAAGLGWSLLVLGLAPTMRFWWWGITHDPSPVSMPVPLTRGEYSSPLFNTDQDEDYRISVEWNAPDASWKALDLDWRIVDDSGALLQQGSYNYRLRGNTASLGHYHSTRKLRQRVILRNLQDARGLDLAHPKLEISVPERSLDAAYGAIYPVMLAILVAVPGALILLHQRTNRTGRRSPSSRLTSNYTQHLGR